MADGRDKDRQSRLGAALRENLKRRKQQLRGRADRSVPQDEDGAEDRAEDEKGSSSGPVARK
jgi:hypothetical protein